MNIELMMKAVNYLKGDLGSYYAHKGGELYLFLNKSTGNYIADSEKATNGCYTMICTCDDFNQLITELSNWQPTLPKVKTVEVDGMIYEIGKLYSFKDIAAKDSAIGALIRVANHNKKFNFLADIDDSQGWFQECKKITCEIGIITPAPVKLVDGAAYAFEYQDEDMLGRYHKGSNRFIIGNSNVKSCNVKNITRLVPEGK